jgi:hypothetical protein
VQAIKKWNGAHDPERAIEQPPGEGDMADVSTNKGEWNDGRAGNQPAAQHPGIANWISKWSDEKQRTDKMPEGEPVGPITDEWKFSVSLFQSQEDEGNPGPKTGNQVIRGRIVNAEPAAKKRKFGEQWKRRQAAQDKSGDEEAQTYPVCEKCPFDGLAYHDRNNCHALMRMFW